MCISTVNSWQFHITAVMMLNSAFALKFSSNSDVIWKKNITINKTHLRQMRLCNVLYAMAPQYALIKATFKIPYLISVSYCRATELTISK